MHSIFFALATEITMAFWQSHHQNLTLDKTCSFGQVPIALDSNR